MKISKTVILTPLTILFTALQVFAQVKVPKSNEVLKISFGRSKHGSGDLKGFSFATGYTRYVKTRIFWSASLGTTIHDGEDTLTYEMFNQRRDGSIRYTTAGVQGLIGLGYNFLRNGPHELITTLSAVSRYQTTSLTNRAIYYPGGTGLPFPVVQFDHWNPSRTFTLGASLSVEYNYTFSKGIVVGLGGAFQTDLNNDVLSHLSLIVGKRF